MSDKLRVRGEEWAGGRAGGRARNFNKRGEEPNKKGMRGAVDVDVREREARNV